MAVGILWKDRVPRLLVSGYNGEYEVVNGNWHLSLDEKTLEGWSRAPTGEIRMKFDKFTYLYDKGNYKTLEDYNEIINDACELGVEKHIDVDVEKENIEGRQRAIERQKELDELHDIPF